MEAFSRLVLREDHEWQLVNARKLGGSASHDGEKGLLGRASPEWR